MSKCLYFRQGKCALKIGCRFVKVEKDGKCPVSGEIGNIEIVRGGKKK